MTSSVFVAVFELKVLEETGAWSPGPRSAAGPANAGTSAQVRAMSLQQSYKPAYMQRRLLGEAPQRAMLTQCSRKKKVTTAIRRHI